MTKEKKPLLELTVHEGRLLRHVLSNTELKNDKDEFIPQGYNQRELFGLNMWVKATKFVDTYHALLAGKQEDLKVKLGVNELQARYIELNNGVAVVPEEAKGVYVADTAAALKKLQDAVQDFNDQIAVDKDLLHEVNEVKHSVEVLPIMKEVFDKVTMDRIFTPSEIALAEVMTQMQNLFESKDVEVEAVAKEIPKEE